MLRAGGARGWLTIAILTASILLNVILLGTDPVYPINFTIASFYLFMAYFLTLLIPLDTGTAGIPQIEILGTLKKLKNQGIIRSTERFSRIFLNAFFINCRPLFWGFTVLFSINIMFAVFVFPYHGMSASTVMMVVFQSVAIIVFYFVIWWLEPYTSDFLTDVTSVRERLIKRRIPARFVSVFLGVGAFLALLSAFTTIILLPGFTVQEVLSISGLERIWDLIVAIGTILISQYFIFRYIHGISSRGMAERFHENKALQLSQQAEKDEAICQNPAAGLPDNVTLRDAACETATILLESRIYQIEKRTLFSTFPVYIVNPDFSVIFDKDTIDTIGHDIPAGTD